MNENELMGFEAARQAKATLISLLEKRKGGLKKAAMRLSESLDAKETKFFQHLGKVVSRRDVVDHGIRLQAAKYVVEIYDALPSKRHDVNIHQTDLSELTDAELEEELADLEEMGADE